MWLIVPVILAALLSGYLIIRFGLVPPPHATTLIKIRNRRIHVSRGRLRAQPNEFISDILQESGIVNGFIAVTPARTVAFSRNIPPNVRQRLRNVLLNE